MIEVAIRCFLRETSCLLCETLCNKILSRGITKSSSLTDRNMENERKKTPSLVSLIRRKLSLALSYLSLEGAKLTFASCYLSLEGTKLRFAPCYLSLQGRNLSLQ